jgi:hypothetical protein
MVCGTTPGQGYIVGQSEQLAHADFSEPGKDAGEDHSAHASGKTCPDLIVPAGVSEPEASVPVDTPSSMRSKQAIAGQRFSQTRGWSSR